MKYYMHILCCILSEFLFFSFDRTFCILIVMGKNKNYPPTFGAQIVAFHQAGLKQTDIARRMVVSQSVVSRTISRWKSTGSLGPTKQPGKPRLTSPQTDRLIKRIIVDNPRVSSGYIAAQLPPECTVSARTVRRRLLNDFKLPSRRPARKPKLSPKNIRDRLSFAQKYKDWSREQWAKVLFSDETQIVQFSSYKGNIRRPARQRFNPRYTVSTVKNSNSVMVWGSISALGRGGLWFCPKGSTINAAVYKSILQEKLQVHSQRLRCTFFQHDGAPCHRAKAVKQWLDSEQIAVIGPWPGQSPDLNPIEMCWTKLKANVSKKNSTSYADLIENIKKVWCLEIEADYCKKLVDTMPDRLAAVIAAKGGPTRY